MLAPIRFRRKSKYEGKGDDTVPGPLLEGQVIDAVVVKDKVHLVVIMDDGSMVDFPISDFETA